jgi:hypothetical protein
MFTFRLRWHVPQRWHDVEGHDVSSIDRHQILQIHRANLIHQPVYLLPNIGLVNRAL